MHSFCSALAFDYICEEAPICFLGKPREATASIWAYEMSSMEFYHRHMEFYISACHQYLFLHTKVDTIHIVPDAGIYCKPRSFYHVIPEKKSFQIEPLYVIALSFAHKTPSKAFQTYSQTRGHYFTGKHPIPFWLLPREKCINQKKLNVKTLSRPYIQKGHTKVSTSESTIWVLLWTQTE